MAAGSSLIADWNFCNLLSRVVLGITILVIAAVTPRSSWAAPIEYVIHLSVDGLRTGPDEDDDLFLQTLIDSGLAPNFARFQTEGAWTNNARTDFSNTYTLPNHTSMITGRPVDQPTAQPNTVHHGFTENFVIEPEDTLHNKGNTNLDYVVSTFDVVHDAGLSTALYASKSKFVIYEQSYDAVTGAPHDNGRDKIDSYVNTSLNWKAAPLNDQFIDDMTNNPFHYTFLHYRDPDAFGHYYGWGSPPWQEAVTGVDSYLGDLFHLVENDPVLNDKTTIILTSDHGGKWRTHTYPDWPSSYTIPFYVWGPNVAQGVDLYSLNTATRLDPGSDRPDYDAPLQPIRNGGSGNLALALLGLAPIPGSSINAAQDLVVEGWTLGHSCDFDADGLCGVPDINILYQQGSLTAGVVTSSSNEAFDLIDDNLINTADLSEWLSQAAITHGYSSPYLRGDTELDRDVDISDFNTLATHFDPDGATKPHSWLEANFDGDNDIDITDFNFLAANFAPEGYGTFTVPESTSAWLLLAGLLTMVPVRLKSAKSC